MAALVGKAAAAHPATAATGDTPEEAALTLREWRISIIGAGTKYLGRVEAPDAESAIAKAAEEFKIDEARRFRLIAQLVD